MDDLITKCRQHISSLCNVECNIFDISLKQFVENNNIYCNRCECKCNFSSTHLYGCYESQRWGNKYIYYCPAGFIFIAISILNDVDMLDYGVITGPIMMGNADDFEPVDCVPNFSTVNVNDIAQLLSILFSKASSIMTEFNSIQNEAFLNDIYKVLDERKIDKLTDYPITIEKELQQAIIEGNETLSKELLNKLLGHIFFNSNNNLRMIKSRVLELIVLLSRSAIEGGANVNDIFTLNSNYIKEVENFDSLEKLSIWLTGVINRFVGYVFEFQDIKHTDTIYKITAYIKENYKNKLTLDDISSYVYLSKSYLSKIFKEEMKCSLTAYINKVRIEKSKILLTDNSLSLVDIANLIGFDDQSYFNKVFKNIVGISPGKYREKQHKI